MVAVGEDDRFFSATEIQACVGDMLGDGRSQTAKDLPMLCKEVALR